MGYLHIYTAKMQPATSWIDSSGEVEISGGCLVIRPNAELRGRAGPAGEGPR